MDYNQFIKILELANKDCHNHYFKVFNKGGFAFNGNISKESIEYAIKTLSMLNGYDCFDNSCVKRD